MLRTHELSLTGPDQASRASKGPVGAQERLRQATESHDQTVKEITAKDIKDIEQALKQTKWAMLLAMGKAKRIHKKLRRHRCSAQASFGGQGLQRKVDRSSLLF